MNRTGYASRAGFLARLRTLLIFASELIVLAAREFARQLWLIGAAKQHFIAWLVFRP
jgi:hypothetical protein